MLKPYLFVFGAIVVAGGGQGFLCCSNKSIIAASLIAACLWIGAFLLKPKPTAGLVLAGIGSLAVAGRFLNVFIAAPDKGAAMWPAGTLSILAIIAIVLIAMAFSKGR